MLFCSAMSALGPEKQGIHSESPVLFEELFESSPDGIIVTDRDGKIVRVNARVEKMFGYGRHELLGQLVEVLVPDRFQAVHKVHRQDYHGEPRKRPMGAGLELYAKRKDG